MLVTEYKDGIADIEGRGGGGVYIRNSWGLPNVFSQLCDSLDPKVIHFY